MGCKVDSLAIVQLLLLNNADFNIKNAKGRKPKEVTNNQRIIYLIEKYEKRQVTGSPISLEDVFEFSHNSTEEEEKGLEGSFGERP